MRFAKFTVPFLMLTLGMSLAHAKEPKYEKPHQLTPEQSALVEKAIAREKGVIKNIQERTPLVERVGGPGRDGRVRLRHGAHDDSRFRVT